MKCGLPFSVSLLFKITRNTPVKSTGLLWFLQEQINDRHKGSKHATLKKQRFHHSDYWISEYLYHVNMSRRINFCSYSWDILLLVWAVKIVLLLKLKLSLSSLFRSIPLPDAEDPTNFLPFINTISQKYS